MEKGKKNHNFWISQPESGLDKRQYSLQILYRSEGKQPNWKLEILFRGKGRVAMYEKLAHYESVNFFFEINAWIDIDLCRKWIDIIPSTFVKDETLETFLLLDNLFCQYSDKFKENVSAIKGLC